MDDAVFLQCGLTVASHRIGGSEGRFGIKFIVLLLIVLLFFQYEGLEASLKDANFEKESTEAQSLEVSTNRYLTKKNYNS